MEKRAPAKAEAYVEQVKAALSEAWLPNIYRQRVLGQRSRSYHLGGTTGKGKFEIQHTLLGVELKVGRRRMLCPDLATARYLSIFARVGSENVGVPYDITRVSQLADELESSWHRTFLLADHYAAAESENLRNKIKRLLVATMKNEINEAGAGSAIPEFKQSTKQRA